ncbi:MAG: hypothetical protein QOE79_1982 [Sphingomonadales bacterium]|jgi:hypothetical protein|nr:hypothetical protein [Sphingomonadales bacterium]
MSALLLALAAASAVPVPAPPPCHLTFPMVPDEAAARRIFSGVLAVRPHRRGPHYLLKVAPDRDDPGKWLVVQTLPPPRGKLPPGRIWVEAGGGGLGMRIDRCTGAVSDLYYQR